MTIQINSRPDDLSKLLGVTRPLRGQAIVVPQRVGDSRAEEVAVISHELRNSLCVVRNAACLLRRQIDAAGIDRVRVLIERHVGQMSRHVEDLLDGSRARNQSTVLRLSHVDLRVIVSNAVDAVTPDFARRAHRLAVSLPADALWLHADEGRLGQVLTNLLINAAKYTPDGGDIALIVERMEEHASIRIRDSGIGISSAVMPRIFDMYAQADGDAPCAEGGRGIGLAVVRKLVEMHRGSVRAVSAGLGLGSEFTVLLPTLWAQSKAPSPAASAR